MKHTDFICLKHKESCLSYLYYFPYQKSSYMVSFKEAFYKEFHENYDDFIVIDFEDIPIDLLSEMLGNILEDSNYHTRAQYEPKLLWKSLVDSDLGDYQMREVFRNFIIGVENELSY